MTENTVFKSLPWIRYKRFSKENALENIHTFFRKNITVDNAGIASAKLLFTSDDYCKVYINGEFTASGPAPGYPRHYYFMELDIIQHLKPGTNCIAAHAYYQGLTNRVWNSNDGFSGLKAQLIITYENGTVQEVVTDDSWRCYDCKAYNSDRKFGYDTQYAEDIDMRLQPDGWKTIDFDDSAWDVPEVITSYPHKLNKQPTLPLSWNKICPQKITCLNEGHYLIDFGREAVGCTTLNIHAPEGHVIEIRHAEELNSDGTARYEMRANCVYQEFITLSGKQESVEFFDYKAFRYVELINYPGKLSINNIAVMERHYPYENVAELKTSNSTLDKIREICALAVKLGTQDSFLDCMSREKGAYLGDAFVTGLSHLYLTGRSEMLKKVLTDFAETSVLCPGLRAVAPGGFEQDIADYSLLFIPLLNEYYMWTNDSDFMRKMQPAVAGVLEYFRQFENSSSLLKDLTGKPVMVDWPENLRDGYEDPGLMGSDTPQSGINTLINMYYYGTLTGAEKFYEVNGESQTVEILKRKSVKLKQSLMEKFFTDKGFVDSDSSRHVSLHPNALALMFKLVPPTEAGIIVKTLKEKRIKCGVYFSFFLLEGLFKYGETEFAYDLLTCDDIHSWQTMLKDGATTCMEAWGIEQKWNTSLCHPWASAPVYMIAAEIFGLKPAMPGWSTVSFNPKVPALLDRGSTSVNIPQGKISVSFKRENETVKYQITIPEGLMLLTSVEQKNIIIN